MALAWLTRTSFLSLFCQISLNKPTINLPTSQWTLKAWTIYFQANQINTSLDAIEEEMWDSRLRNKIATRRIVEKDKLSGKSIPRILWKWMCFSLWSKLSVCVRIHSNFTLFPCFWHTYRDTYDFIPLRDKFLAWNNGYSKSVSIILGMGILFSIFWW